MSLPSEQYQPGTCTTVQLRRNTKSVHCLEYIIVHEMIHLLERHHNERFIVYMNNFMPLWQFYREELNRAPLGHEAWRYWGLIESQCGCWTLDFIIFRIQPISFRSTSFFCLRIPLWCLFVSSVWIDMPFASNDTQNLWAKARKVGKYACFLSNSMFMCCTVSSVVSIQISH